MLSKLTLRRLPPALLSIVKEKKEFIPSHLLDSQKTVIFLISISVLMCHCCDVTWLLSASDSSFANGDNGVYVYLHRDILAVNRGCQGKSTWSTLEKDSAREISISFLLITWNWVARKSQNKVHFASNCWISTICRVIWIIFFPLRVKGVVVIKWYGRQHTSFLKGYYLDQHGEKSMWASQND